MRDGATRMETFQYQSSVLMMMALTERNASFEVVNKAPTIEPIEMWVDGVYLEQLDGMWHLDEYQTVTLKVQGSDTLFDLDSLQVGWSLSERMKLHTQRILLFQHWVANLKLKPHGIHLDNTKSQPKSSTIMGQQVRLYTVL